MRHLTQDISAAFVVFLVAMPLCMGIALASGVPAERGLLTGIIGGIVVGLFAGSPLQVSGPAAGLVVMVIDIVRTHGIGALGPVLVLAGLLQAAAGLLRLGQWFRAISPAVVHGMLAGIGLLIVAGQLHVLVDGKPMATGMDNLLAAPAALLGAFTPQGELAALAVGLLTIGAMLGWERFRPARLKLLPGALMGVAAGTLAAIAFTLPVQRVAVPDSLWQAVTPADAGLLAGLARPELMLAALALAFVASAESLLSASAVDRMQSRVRTNYDRELLAQGLGNGVSGLLGGLPITGVIVRSSANVQAGARTRASAILHGLLILGFVALAPGLLREVPTAALAGVLLVTGWRLVNLRHVRELWQAHGRLPAVIWVATFAGVVAMDLLTGVLAGLALSVLESARHLHRLGFRLRASQRGTATELRLAGTATFLRLPQLLKAVEAVPPDRELRIRTRGLRHMDHSFAATLHHLAEPGSGRRVVLA